MDIVDERYYGISRTPRLLLLVEAVLPRSNLLRLLLLLLLAGIVKLGIVDRLSQKSRENRLRRQRRRAAGISDDDKRPFAVAAQNAVIRKRQNQSRARHRARRASSVGRDTGEVATAATAILERESDMAYYGRAADLMSYACYRCRSTVDRLIWLLGRILGLISDRSPPQPVSGFQNPVLCADATFTAACCSEHGKLFGIFITPREAADIPNKQLSHPTAVDEERSIG